MSNGALREWRIPLLMTDGRAITGMTADSHAHSHISAFFSPGISIFSDRTEPIFGIGASANRVPFCGMRCGISEIFNMLRTIGPQGGAAAISNRAFTIRSIFFMRHLSTRLLNNCRFLFLSHIFPLSLFSFSVTAFISCHHRVVTGYSTIGNTYLHREVVRTQVIRSSQISIFRWTECLRYWQSRRSRLIGGS